MFRMAAMRRVNALRRNDASNHVGTAKVDARTLFGKARNHAAASTSLARGPSWGTCLTTSSSVNPSLCRAGMTSQSMNGSSLTNSSISHFVQPLRRHTAASPPDISHRSPNEGDLAARGDLREMDIAAFMEAIIPYVGTKCNYGAEKNIVAKQRFEIRKA